MSNLTTAPHAAGLNSSTFTIKRPWLSWLGNKYWVYAPDGALVAFVKMPIFRWKPEMTIYADESMQSPLMHLVQQKLMTLKPTFDVMDVTANTSLGAIRKLAMKSIVRDEWELLDGQGNLVGNMKETGNSFLRRVFPLLLGKWEIRSGNAVAHIQQVFTLFSKEFTLELGRESERIEPRFAIACAVFALVAESVRESSG